jgi:membrane protease YdiL (CAAX protease family)
VRLQPPTRNDLLWETRFVMLAFLFPGVAAAVVLIVRHAFNAGGSPSPLGNVVPGHPLVSLLIGIPVYLEVATVAPLALLLLARTGQGPAALGLRVPGLRSDVWPALGLIGAGFGVDVLLSIPFTPLLKDHPGLINPTQIGHVPGYYVLYGLAVSATTAFGEEVIVNGYFLTRLEQLGWGPTPALVLSLTLRTSYHVYYGIGFLFTVPIGYFLTRSFQKNHRLTRPIVAHFLYDAILITIAVLTS